MRDTRLPPDVNRILFVRNLPFKVSSQELYDLFGKYGSVRQVRLGNSQTTRGTGFVVYDDIFDAKNACEHLSGFNLGGRYLIVLYHSQAKHNSKMELRQKEQHLNDLKSKA
jgi:pre-mRNA branch site protein p14